MSEITKLYENAGIEKCNSTLKDIIPNICLKECEEETYKCKDCEHFEYSPFTAEKQIELIKFITTLGVCEIENWNDKGFHFAIKRERIYPTMFLSLSNINLQETLADVINNLWQDLTEEEKASIKNILEM